MDRRLYTPPTCTLLLETSTPWLPKISRQSEQPKVANLANLANFNFALSFDDPRQTGDSVTVKGDRSLLDRLYVVVNTYIQKLLAAPSQLDSLDTAAIPTVANVANVANTATLQLQQQDLLTHTLYLGEQATVPKIDLTTTQLFDLATALDAYSRELDIPAPENYWWKSTWFSSWGLGATAMFLFMGLTSLGFQLLQARNSANSNPEAPLPSRNNAVTSGLQIFPTPKASIPPLPKVSPLGTTQKLSLPAPVLVPPSGIAPTTPLLVPPERVGNSPIIFSERGNPSGNSSVNSSINNSNNSNSSNNSNNSNNSSNYGAELIPTPRQGGINRGNNSASTSIQNPTIVPVSPLPELPSLPSLNPDAVIRVPPQEVPAMRVNEDLNINYRNSPNQLSQSSQSFQSSQSSQRGESLFDRIPQVPEVRKYVQARWQPPLGLNQILEYSILLNNNGTIAQIIPLGQAAAANIDRLGMPSLNLPFVSPLVSGGNSKIRIVLTPEGGVETFLESLN